MTELVVQSISALAMVLALFAGVVWLLRRLQQRGEFSRGDAIRVRQRTMLGSRHSLVEVEYAGQRLLLGLGPESVTPIMQREAPVASEASGKLPVREEV